MNDDQIIRPRLGFEREYGQHRNWWVRDPRLTGNPLSILLFLLSHDQKQRITQREAQQTLEIGKDAWASAKRRLMETGFLLEIRDRYPEGHRDDTGRPKGGQKRFRLILRDPTEGTMIDIQDAIIEADSPVDDPMEMADQSQCGFSAVDGSASAENPHWAEKPQVGASADNPQSGQASADYPQSFKEEKTGRFGRSIDNDDFSTDPTDRAAREAAVDEQLSKLVPGLTVARIEAEVEGRVDLSSVDLVQAAKGTLLRAAAPVSNPARYLAAVLVRKPDAWPLSAAPFVPPTVESPAHDRRSAEQAIRAACAGGEHDWGPEVWGELARAACVHCYTMRRSVDPAFADLEEELDQIGGGQ